MVTVSCVEGAIGNVYPGELQYSAESIGYDSLPKTNTHLLINIGDPEKAFSLASIPADGVGLARIEFVITSSFGVHPMALANYPKLKKPESVESVSKAIAGEDPKQFFVRRLSEGIARIAAAFYPRPVIVRTSDFKS